MMDAKKLCSIVKAALEEDVGTGDVTTEAVIPKGMTAKARMVANEDCVVCGLDAASEVFRQLGGVSFRKLVSDGDCVKAGQALGEATGNARSLLTGERTALNFLQRLSGIATRTSGMVKKAGSSKVRILDTRKTTPGLRMLEKYAVRCGGGENHRAGLYDGILIKDNHIGLVGIRRAVEGAKPVGKKIEVEAKTLDEVKEAVSAGADIVMLDNMDISQMKEAVRVIRSLDKGILIEVSGGVNEGNIGAIAKLSVDWISIGALTHSVKSVDIGMDLEKM
jgi:nicotinate-nucleotide pyrophosphorylase (carboxylating)